MDSEELGAETRIARHAWRYAFHARLVARGAPATDAQLCDLAQAVQIMKGHLDPIDAAEAVLLTWPFEVTEWGGLH